jgi:tetratricopeptide (TPR) repeat protein
MGKGDHEKALEYIKLNTERNPDDPNVFDSLGECYKMMGDQKQAIKALKKSLSLDPPANVKANSIKLLKEMGVDTSEYESAG